MLNKDFKEFVELLNANGVEYLVVGGYALAAHGHPSDVIRSIRAGGYPSWMTTGCCSKSVLRGDSP